MPNNVRDKEGTGEESKEAKRARDRLHAAAETIIKRTMFIYDIH